MTKRIWTQADYDLIVDLRNQQLENNENDWEVIAQHFGVSRQNAIAAYRRAVGAKHSSYKDTEKPDDDFVKKEYEQGEDFINVICASRRVLSKEEIIKQFKIDMNDWEIESFKVKTSEGYRKDRQVKWKVSNGLVTSGEVNDTGKMLVVPLYHIEVRLKRKAREIEVRSIIDALIENAKRFSPKYPKINYPKISGGLLYEIAMYDIHFGRLTWDEESGANYDIKIAEFAIKSSLLKLLAYVEGLPVKRILLPIGNDFFNVDSKFNTTTGGTPQQEDTRWQKTFNKGVEICTWMIDACSQIAPVDVLVIPGNHDEQRSFYLGAVLSAWYNKNESVSIDNSPSPNKYYHFGKCLIGFAHGNDIRLEKLPFIMANDKPELWAKSEYREWHTGDKHHKKGLHPFEDEGTGMLIRIIRSLVAYDSWTFRSGYRSLRASESFLWHPEDGLNAQYTALPDIYREEDYEETRVHRH